MGALSNALSNAAQSLLNNAAGIFNGTNPLVQPQIAQILGVNIPAQPLISTRDYFLAQLNTWLTSPALHSQWICVIDKFPTILNSAILRTLERTAGNYNAYDINIAKLSLTSYPFQRVAGCIFANNVTVPGESYDIESVSVENNRGFLPGIVGGKRSSYAENRLKLSFYESNTSFIDFVIRPWVMLASHYGYVTRKEEKYNIKCNITLLHYSKTFQNISMIPRKVFKFYNCVPTDVGMRQHDYTEKDTVESYEAGFAFTNYTVENNLYLPLPQLINSYKSGKLDFPKISPFQK
jgi:hypothetical protein